MLVREAKDFLVQQVAEQAALENVPLSDLEKRMIYFTERGDCPEDPIALNEAFEAQYDTAAYEKKISRLMARACRRIKQNDPEKLHFWNEAFRVLNAGDHYILVFWRRNPFRKSAGVWPTYALGALAIAAMFLLTHFLFGNKRRGGRAPVDNYLPVLSPAVQHILQLLFLLALVFAIFPQIRSRLTGALQRVFRSASSAQRQK